MKKLTVASTEKIAVIHRQIKNFQCHRKQDLAIAQRYLSLLFNQLAYLASSYQKKFYRKSSKQLNLSLSVEYKSIMADYEAEQQLVVGLIYVLQQKLILALATHLT